MTTSSSNIKQVVQKQFAHVASNYSTSAVHAKGKDLQTMVDCENPPNAYAYGRETP